MIAQIKHILFLLKNEIKRTYGGSLLGVAWLILNPVLYALVYYFLFEKIIKIKFNFKIPNASYFHYLIIGLILWSSFVMGILRGSNSIVENSYILKKVLIKPEYFPIVYTLMYSLQAFVFLSFLIILLKVYDVKLLLALPVTFINFYLFLLGVSFILSALTVYIRDIPQLLNNVLNFVFYTIPIIYPYDAIPNDLKYLVLYNPLVYIFKPFHDILFYKSLELYTIGIGTVISLLAFSIGWFFFRKLKEGFYDVL